MGDDVVSTKSWVCAQVLSKAEWLNGDWVCWQQQGRKLTKALRRWHWDLSVFSLFRDSVEEMGLRLSRSCRGELESPAEQKGKNSRQGKNLEAGSRGHGEVVTGLLPIPCSIYFYFIFITYLFIWCFLDRVSL